MSAAPRTSSTRPGRCYHCDKARPAPNHRHEYTVVRDGRLVLVVTYGGRRPLGGDPDPRTASGAVAVRRDAGDLQPPGCAAGHSPARLAECDGCGEAWCTGPGCLEGSTVQKPGEGRRHRCPAHRHGPECYSQADDRPGLACAHATATARHLAERLALYRAWSARVAARRAR